MLVDTIITGDYPDLYLDVHFVSFPYSLSLT